MPKVLSLDDQSAFAQRLAGYVKEVGLLRCVVVFHGGEPLLMGAPELVQFADRLRAAVGGDVALDIGMQTNGLLLTKPVIDLLGSAGIAVSLSLDGPAEANDLHRNSKKGRSSFQRVVAGLELLKAAPDVFAGVIAVVDPRVEPRTLLEFFSSHDVPKLDFLLPDAHHMRPPPGRADNPSLYERWLISAFDLWLDEFPHLPVRTFESLLDALAGLPSQTDAFGFGDVSLITVETDGTYHDLDVLKVVGQGATRIGGSVRDTDISAVARSPQLDAHRKLLRRDGLCKTCQACDVVEICGGGSLPHRHHLNGFGNPTVYCKEMKALVRHAKARLEQSLASSAPLNRGELDWQGSLSDFERAETSKATVDELWREAFATQRNALSEAIAVVTESASLGSLTSTVTTLELEELAKRPGSVAWANAVRAIRDGCPVHAVDGTPLPRDDDYLTRLQARGVQAGDAWEIHEADPWLRKPFGESIYFEDSEAAACAVPVLAKAFDIIKAWRPTLAAEMQQICRAVQFVRDPSADPAKIVSFSDNSVPGALFVSVYRGDDLIDPYDLADSLIHEYRHQKLYLLERRVPLVASTNQKVVSPWREELRPPSGLFHAIFVFIELRRFWGHVLANGPADVTARAVSQLDDTERNLAAGFVTLAQCPLTKAGRDMATILEVAMSTRT